MELPEEPPQGTTRVELWFADGKDPTHAGSALVVYRDIPETTSIASAALRAWIQGPTDEELASGAIPSAPSGTKLLEVSIEDGTAIVDLSESFERTGMGTTYEGALLDQLAGTITQFESVERALLRIEGRFKPYYMSHGFIIDERHPLTRPHKKRYRFTRTC